MNAPLPAGHAGCRPFPLTLGDALAHVEREFGIDRLLTREGVDIVAPYYRQSGSAYRRAHSRDGCMHLALNPDGRFDPDGYFAQLHAVSAQIAAVGARRVLELGCGMGFNARFLSRAHPRVQLTGLDLMAAHIRFASRRAATLENLTLRQGDYAQAPPPAETGVFDLVFAIETLCYARRPDAVAANIARWLKPGGRVVIFDGFRRPDFDTAPADVITAARLFEVTTAVTCGFWRTEDWCGALERAGLRQMLTQDLTAQTLAGVRRLQHLALRLFLSWKRHLLMRLLPQHMLGNAVAGLLGPYMVEGPDPMSGQGAISYSMLVAEKPR